MAGVALAVDDMKMVRGFVGIIVYSMLILALDTTSRAGSCAVARDSELLREQGSDPERPPAARLPADLMTLLDDAGVALPQVDLFAVATGPGSFTGLRIGIATMQGLAFAMRKPLVGVSALDALASMSGVPVSSGTMPTPSTYVATWVDAWRGEVYAALYGGGVEPHEPVVALPEKLLQAYADVLRDCGTAQRRMCFVGDGADTYRELILGTLGDAATIAEPASPRLAQTIAALALEQAELGELPPPHAIRPLYVRRSDAELARGRG
jgi:tRNA threonylcarbamoyladenosine biosynthesis protein TsaB